MSVEITADPELEIEIEFEDEVTEPNRWRVIFHNDNVTPMDFVVLVLKDIFHYDLQRAHRLMLQIHEEGSGVAGVYTHEIAEEKAAHTISAARHSGFPLQVTIEEEEDV